MKKTAFTNLTLVVCVAAALSTGCRSKRPDKNITPIPGVNGGLPGDDPIGGGGLDRGPGGAGDLGLGGTLGTGGGLEGVSIGDAGTGAGGLAGTDIGTMPGIPELTPPPSDAGGTGTIPMGELGEDGMFHDANAFSANTIYFGYDSSVVRADELVKLDEVIQIMKAEPRFKLIVEGHCDERGTEEYNRSLGERRANSVRERLINAGIDSTRVRTISYGEDKPAEFGHDESSWTRNRRSEFILLRPPSN